MPNLRSIQLGFSRTVIVEVKTKLTGTMLHPESAMAKLNREDAEVVSWNKDSHVLVTEEGEEIEITIDNIQNIFKYLKPSEETVNEYIETINNPDTVIIRQSDGKVM